jgi:KDO2-lipid IV(A) lauroyltransferase
MRTERLGEARFRVIAYPPVQLDTAEPDEQARAIAVTARLNALMAQWIREQPDEWMCANRRWEKSLHRSLPS